MEKTNELFATIEHEGPIPRNDFPYVIMAYWGKGNYWKVFPGMFSDYKNENVKQLMWDIQSRGWSHVRIVKLPE